MNKALLVNLSAPEIDRLAVELAARGALVGLVRRYVNKRRLWERILENLPLIGASYAATLGRRLPPTGLDPKLVVEAGVGSDFACAVLARLARIFPALAGRWDKRLLALTEADVSQAGAMRLQSPNAVVASYHVAYPAFTKARKLGCRTVLNYPIAHHAWQYKLYANCAEQYPQFAQALPRFGSVQEHAALLDREIALADVILVGSQFVKNTFISEGIPAGKVRVIPYGADPQRFQPAAEPRPESGPFRVLFVGQIGERKGISHLLKAYARFCKPDTELHLVGNYVAGAEVYAPWRNHYQHTPNVPQTQLPEIFRSADVFVLPTLVEGMPMVVLEAMACGLPVVVTPNGPAEVVRDGIDGFVVPSGDSDAIVASLERLYADRSLRLEMGRNATQQATQWPWSRYARAAADEVLAI